MPYLYGRSVDLSADPLSFAFGLDQRRNRLVNPPDAVVTDGGASSMFIAPASGNAHADEINVE